MMTTYLAHLYGAVYTVSPMGKYWVPKNGEQVILDEINGQIRVWPWVESGPEGMEVAYRWSTQDHMLAAKRVVAYWKRKAWWK